MASNRSAALQTAIGAASTRADRGIESRPEDQMTLSEVARALATPRITRGWSPEVGHDVRRV
jgi:hypothetical protein